MQAIFTLSIGLNDKDTKRQELSRETAVNRIFDALSDCTILDAMGQFTHEDGARVREKSLRVYVYGEEENFQEVCNSAAELCGSLNQECIVAQMTRQNGSFETRFISGR